MLIMGHVGGKVLDLMALVVFGTAVVAGAEGPELWAPKGRGVERFSPCRNWKIVQGREGNDWRLSVFPVPAEADGKTSKVTESFSLVRTDAVVAVVVTDQGGIGWVEYSDSGRRMKMFVATKGEAPVLVSKWERTETCEVTLAESGVLLPMGFPVCYRSCAVPELNKVVFVLGEFAESGDPELGQVDSWVFRIVDVDSGVSQIRWSRPRIGLPLRFVSAGSGVGLIVAVAWNWEANESGAWELWVWDLRANMAEPVKSSPVSASGPIQVIGKENGYELEFRDDAGRVLKRFKWHSASGVGKRGTLVELMHSGKGDESPPAPSPKVSPGT